MKGIVISIFYCKNLQLLVLANILTIVRSKNKLIVKMIGILPDQG